MPATDSSCRQVVFAFLSTLFSLVPNTVPLPLASMPCLVITAEEIYLHSPLLGQGFKSLVIVDSLMNVAFCELEIIVILPSSQ